MKSNICRLAGPTAFLGMVLIFGGLESRAHAQESTLDLDSARILLQADSKKDQKRAIEMIAGSIEEAGALLPELIELSDKKFAFTTFYQVLRQASNEQLKRLIESRSLKAHRQMLSETLARQHATLVQPEQKGALTAKEANDWIVHMLVEGTDVNDKKLNALGRMKFLDSSIKVSDREIEFCFSVLHQDQVDSKATPSLQHSAAMLLRKCEPNVRDRLLAGLEHQTPEYRCGAMLSLSTAEVLNEQIVSTLLSIGNSDQHHKVQSAVASALAETEAMVEPSAEWLLKWIVEERPNINAAFVALAKLGPRASLSTRTGIVNALARYVGKSRSGKELESIEYYRGIARHSIHENLASMNGPEVQQIVDGWLRFLKPGDVGNGDGNKSGGGIDGLAVQYAATIALAEANAKAATAAIKELIVSSSEREERLRLAENLWHVSGEADSVLPVIMDSLNEKFDGSYGAQQQGLSTLRLLGPQAVDAVPRQIEILESNEDPEPIQVFLVLEDVGPAATDAMPAISKYLDHEDMTTHHYAVDALIAIISGNEAAKGSGNQSKAKAIVPAITPLLDHEKVRRQRNACRLLTSIGPDAKEALPALKRYLGSTDDEKLIAEVEAAINAIENDEFRKRKKR